MGTLGPAIVEVLTPLLAALAAAAIALLGSRWLQNGLGRRLREAEELKERLYFILTLAADYWAIAGRRKKERETREARILAEKNIVILQLAEMQRYSPKLRRWYSDTLGKRLDLFDALTGGCFQQQNWSPDPKRVLLAARTIQFLVSGLNRAC